MTIIRRTGPAIAILLLTSLLLTSCGGGDGREGSVTSPAPGSTSAAPAAIGGQATIALFAFDPEVVAVDPGATVTWTNTDQILHTVTAGSPDSPAGDFDELLLDGVGSTGLLAFPDQGTFEFFCARHTHMRITVEVGGG